MARRVAAIPMLAGCGALLALAGCVAAGGYTSVGVGASYGYSYYEPIGPPFGVWGPGYYVGPPPPVLVVPGGPVPPLRRVPRAPGPPPPLPFREAPRDRPVPSIPTRPPPLRAPHAPPAQEPHAPRRPPRP